MKKILLLGASGSIGEQTLDIIEENDKKFKLVAFSVGNKHNYIPQILNKHKFVKYIYLIDTKLAKYYRKIYKNITFYSGKNGLHQLCLTSDFDMCVNALVGFAGLVPSIDVIKKNKILCLANKESLVTGGHLINKLLSKGLGKLYPIDSEHVAISKCLKKTSSKNVKQIIITASGGALRNIPLDELKNVKKEDALNHPTWKMGNKITIDSATMMNKGFEIIEAFYLFNFPLEKIKVIMHDESYVHSMIELNDGSFIIDYGKPDMHMAIEYALFETKNKYCVLHKKTYLDLENCHFHEYNPKRYPLTELAKECLKDSPSKLIALNAANEVAVNLFLNDKISFPELIEIIQKTVKQQKSISNPSLSLIKYINNEAKEVALKYYGTR